ncbi:hypothetical protein F5X99DRAFT_426351 [Biscogniauxia marginata]|nr:hypothetical protein F5X99DRAFT_426351 [Biscogniauxia marginata]
MSSTMTETKTKKAKRSGRVYTTTTLTVDPPATMTGVQTPPQTPIALTTTTGSGQDSPVLTVVNGTAYTSAQLTHMGNVLARARAEEGFPTTTAPGYNIMATVEDYHRLLKLRELCDAANIGLSEYAQSNPARILYINIVRDIRERDETIGEAAATANVEARVSGMMNGVQAESALYQLIRHAVHSVVQNGGAQQNAANSGVDITGVLRDVDRHLTDLTSAQENGVSAIMTQMRNTVQGRLSLENPELSGVAMESVFEEVFAYNRMDGQYNRMDGQYNRMDGQYNRMDGQVNAIGQHVNAMGNLLNSTNTNVQALSTNLGVLQTIMNMLPQMVVQAIQEMLPGILHEAVGSAVRSSVRNSITNELVGNLQTFVGALNNARAQVGSSGKSASGSNEKGKSGGKKNGKKGGFMNKFFGIFKKNDRDDGAGHGPSGLGPGMVF